MGEYLELDVSEEVSHDHKSFGECVMVDEQLHVAIGVEMGRVVTVGSSLMPQTHTYHPLTHPHTTLHHRSKEVFY